MLPNWGFQIIFINIIFYFLNVKNDFFCEASTQNMMQNGTHPIFTQISPYLKDNIVGDITPGIPELVVFHTRPRYAWWNCSPG